MIVITGAAGFIGSCLVAHLNSQGMEALVLVDDFSFPEKEKNLAGKVYREKIHRDDFHTWIEEHAGQVEIVLHIGARTDTTEFDMRVFDRLNLGYSKMVWEACSRHGIPLIYASSAATYGMGELGYADDHELIPRLQPLNPYGISKNEFDKWALQQALTPPLWAGLKFFNVYGPNEYHKGRMASVVFHAHRQIAEGGTVKLFRSHRPDYADGMQLRDFIYVKDVVKVIGFLMEGGAPSGIYNLGSGTARSFNELVSAVFDAMGKERKIEYIDTPADIRDKYQYFTEARMEKLRLAGYPDAFLSLEEGVNEYVTEFLASNNTF